MTKRFRWILVGLVVGLVMGGVAFAVVINPPNSGDRYYACVSSTGVVKPSTIKRNVEPTSCPSATDVVHSWNAIGTTGPSGPTGSSGPTGATGPGPDVIRTTTILVTDTSYPIPQNGYGALLGPIDVSACRSVTVNVVGYSASFARIYSFDPESGASVYRSQWADRSISGGVDGGDVGATINLGDYIIASGNSQGFEAAESFPDLGGTLPAKIKIALGSLSTTPAGSASRVWLDCVPWV